MDGKFKALDATTGHEVWSVALPSGVIGQPITHRGPDGKQYVAVFSGVGGWAGAIVSLGLDPRDLRGKWLGKRDGRSVIAHAARRAGLRVRVAVTARADPSRCAPT